MLVDKVALGRRIKAMRQNLEMTQEEFAERLNCTNSHLGKIENGKGGISIELLVSVANMLHTTVDQLLLDSYDYKEQVIMRDLYERIDKFPVKTKATPHKLQSFRLAEVYQHILWITSAVLPAKAH